MKLDRGEANGMKIKVLVEKQTSVTNKQTININIHEHMELYSLDQDRRASC